MASQSKTELIRCVDVFLALETIILDVMESAESEAITVQT